jgi:tRNA pseudouridine38-40 synthase
MTMNVDENLMVFDVVGESFLWNMVRKMITSLILVGKDELEIEDIKKLLGTTDLRENIRLQPAPANGLILREMDYKNIIFKDNEYHKNKLIEELQKQFLINEQEKYADKKLIEILKN